MSVKKISFAEFISLVALITSMATLSIDAILPALADIGKDLHVERCNDIQLTISVLFLGLALGHFLDI